MKQYQAHYKIAVMMMVIVNLYGCGGRPARKKMPDNPNDQQSWEGVNPSIKRPTSIADFPFYTKDTLLRRAGFKQQFISVAMPDPAKDTLSLNLVKASEPFTGPLLASWVIQGRKGILLDLRDGGSEQSRADFVLGKSVAGTVFKVPVSLLWDTQSAGRAAVFIKELQALPGVNLTQLDTANASNSNCFSIDKPSLDN